MNLPKYYYLIKDVNNKWVLHRRGCDNFLASKEKIFLGTIYTSYQALGFAKQRVAEFSICKFCLKDDKNLR